MIPPVTREPDSPAAARHLDDAIKHLEQAVLLSPGNARYGALLGEAWLLKGDPEAALAPLQSSIHQEIHPRVASLLALALLKLDRPADAERFATAALEETSAFHRAYFIRAEARVGQGDSDGAVDDLRQAVALAPESEPYRLRLAGLLVERRFLGAGDRAELIEARALLDGVEDPREGAAWRYLRGCVLIELDDPEAALVALADLSWPTATEVALRRGYAHLALNQRDEALTSFEEARADPELTEVADRLIERLEAGPDHEAPTVRAAPVTQMITSVHAATELMTGGDDTEEMSEELAMLDGDADEPDSGRQLAPTERERPAQDVDAGDDAEDDRGS